MKLTKVFNASIIVASILAFTACSGGSSSSSTKDANLKNVQFPLEKEATLNVMIQSSPIAPSDPNEKLVFSRLQKETNVKINWSNYAWDSYAEKRNLKIASGDLPDAFFDAGFSDSDILKYSEDGVIIPIEDLIDKYMPNVKAIFDKYPEYRKFVTAPDGHIYTLPWIEELGAGKESIHSTDSIAWINTKWLENLGLKMPTTPEEFKTVLEAFKTQDPDGNGNPNDEIPMSFIYDKGAEDMKFLLGAFGYGDNWDHTVVNNDGKVIYTLQEDGYKEALTWLSSLYKDKLIDVDAFSQDWNTYLAKGSKKKYGVYFTWDMGNVTGFNSGDYSKPEQITADYAPMPALTGKNGWKNVTRTNGFGLDRGRFAISSANKNLELTAKWIDKMYEPLQSAQNNWGTYGDTKNPNIFELTNDGKFLKHLPLGKVSPWELRQKTFVGGPLAILDEYYGKFLTIPDDAAWRMNIVKGYVSDMKMDNNFPRIFYSNEDQKKMTEWELQLFQYGARTAAEMIQKGVTDAKWAEYKATLDKMGAKEWIATKQKYYDNFKK